jgi:hypothetical protein
MIFSVLQLFGLIDDQHPDATTLMMHSSQDKVSYHLDCFHPIHEQLQSFWM